MEQESLKSHSELILRETGYNGNKLFQKLKKKITCIIAVEEGLFRRGG